MINISFIFIYICIILLNFIYCDDVNINNDGNILFSDLEENDTNDKYIILLINRLGLANRLKTIADWHQIAKISNRKLLISWEETPDCNIKFTDLFEDAEAGIKFLPVSLPKGIEGEKHVESLSDSYGYTYLTMRDELDINGDNWWKYKDTIILSNKQVLSNVNVIITSYDGGIVLEGINCQYYLLMRSRFLKSLVPIKELNDYVYDIMINHFNNVLLIGIHIRMHDSIQDWKVVPPLNGNKALEFGDGASLEDFDNIMTNINNKLSHYNTSTNLLEEPRHKFYLASNDHNIKSYFVGKYSNIVSIGNSINDRNDPSSIKHALIDWLILSKSDLIINTYGSSFASEASQVHMTPNVGIWGSKIIHHTDTRLPYCGHMQFMKAYNTNGQPSSYTEGTHDNREIKGVIVPLGICHHLIDWGVGEVYCAV
jgi:hypothetical protein